MAEIPKSIDVWVCPACGRANTHHPGQQGSLCGCTGWNGHETRRERAVYVLAEPTDEIAAWIRSTNETFEIAFARGTGPRHRQGVARSTDLGTLANAFSTTREAGR